MPRAHTQHNHCYNNSTVDNFKVRTVFVGVVALTSIFEVAFIVLVAVAAHQALHALQLLYEVTRNK
jgi:hypothetical protein